MAKKSLNNKYYVPGFSFSGISSGIKKSGTKDLALIVSERPANIAGVFTTNMIKAAPVKLDSFFYFTFVESSLSARREFSLAFVAKVGLFFP